MRLNWFSPLPPARTDIANYTARLLPVLAERAKVHVWASQDTWRTSEAPGVTIKSALQRELPWIDINFREYSIYQIGNDVRFHGPLLDLHSRHGGIVVLHDTNLHEMQRMHLVERLARPDAYLALLSRSGGEAAVEMGRAVLRGELPVDEAASAYPLTDSVLAGVHGVVVHNPTQLDVVAQQTNAPCLYLPLPYASPDELPTLSSPPSALGGPLRMVMFGFLHGTNRRLEPLLEAWASFPQRDRLRLTLFGEFDRPHLERRLEGLGLRSLVELNGYLDDADMHAALNGADLALNLRYPSRGEASGSLLRIWSHGLPCFVSDAGYYGDLDPQLVTKIDPANERSGLHRHWKAFLQDPNAYRAQGKAGRHYLEAHHSPAAYVEQLMSFLPQVAKYRAEAYLERWLPRVTHEFLSPIPEWTAQSHWKQRLSSELDSWFTPSERPQTTGPEEA